MAIPQAWRRLRTAERRTARAARRVRTLVRARAPLDATASAKAAGLRYVDDRTMPGIRRLGRGSRFRYALPSNASVKDRAALQRIRSLAIPPAWTDVWICPTDTGHMQATGRDARGRKQYRYHPRWREVRDEVKYGKLIAFAEALPRIRRHTDKDLAGAGLSREKVLAAVVQLLEKTLIRVGNEEYARHNGSIGLTTMRDAHAKISGGKVRFAFRGKSRIEHSIDLEDRRLARIIKACRDLPGYELFQYEDEDGTRQVIDSADVNQYLRDITGEDFSAKDFRTWAGTVLAARALADMSPCTSSTQAKRNVVQAVETVAKRLGNTKAVCRKCYIHPAILDSYLDGATIATLRRRAAALSARGLDRDEAAVVAVIEHRLRKKSA